jgi:Cu/Ag efflux pump CusA
VQFQGGREYAMRIWLDPDKVATHNLSAADVLAVLRAQNLQVSAGVLNRPPVPGDRAYQINVEARGRLTAPEEFGNIVLKSDSQGRVTRVRDVGHAEIGAVDYGNTAFVDRDDASSLLIYAEPGAARTENVIREASDIILTTKGIEHIAPFAGLDATTSTVASNSGTIFSGLPSLYNHELPGVNANSVGLRPVYSS